MLSEALRLIRVYHDLSQSELAKRLDISKSYLSEIESGTKAPSLSLVDSYSEEFGIPSSSILFFAEQVDGGSTKGAREFVSSKILALLRFIEQRKGIKRAKRKGKLPS